MTQQARVTTDFSPMASSIDEALTEIFEFDAFRRGQRETIEAVEAGRDTVVVMPTGSGKSLCYMLPACVIDGLVVVVSPLIALMKDQTDALDQFGVPATYINSSLTRRERRRRLGAMREGAYKLVFVAPERFNSDVFMQAVDGVPVGLFAIDEAHCISQWGHDFRPDYLTLDEVRETLGEPTTLALTATATPRVQDDIAEQLEMEEPKVVVSGFERENLFFECYQARRKTEKLGRLTAALGRVDHGSALVYCATRKQVGEVGDKLREEGYHPAQYHGGMASRKRDEIQDAFMAGDAPVLVATNAFGMGVDKSDVRLIVHYNIPGSVEAYYQEAGRAGRDGDDSHCLLLYNRNDRNVHEFFIENSHPQQDTVERVWDYLHRKGTGTHMLDAETIARHVSRGRGERVHSWGVQSCLRLLEQGGHVAFGTRDGEPWIEVVDRARTRELRVDWATLKKRRKVEEEQLDDVVRYATGNSCRQDFLSRYFRSGTRDRDGCTHCDVCCGPPDYGDGSGQDKVTTTDSPQVLVKKLLSGVARSQRRRGGWGAHAVAGMLRGSTAKKIRNAGLDELSTYGLLSNLRQRDLVRLLDALQRAQLTRQDVHGCLHLTERGQEVMTSDDELPPDVAKTVGRHVESIEVEGPGGDSSVVPEIGDTYLRTLRLHNEQMSYEEIADERGLTNSSVLRHFMVLTDHGYELNLEAGGDDELLAELRESAADWSQGDELKPLKQRLSTQCSYEELRLNLAILLGERTDDATSG